MDKNNGFTFIELIVVVAIIAIFSAISLSYFNSFTTQTELRNEARKLADVLELAKNKAVAGDGPDSCTDGFTGYRVDVAASYTLSSCCADACSSVIQTYNFPSNVSATNGYVRFKQLAAGIETDFSSSEIKVKNSQMGTNNCIVITLNSAGTVNVADDLSNCP